jgi:hypothetical protein
MRFFTPLELLEGEDSKETSPHLLFRRFSACYLSYASLNMYGVKAQHERRARKKDMKSVKEIHSHLKLQPPRSPIASEGEESPEIETFEERIARYDVETLVQQWYGDVSFSGFNFDYGGAAGASSSHPPPFDSPPLAHTHDDEGEENRGQDEDDEWTLSKTSPTSFWCFMTKGEKFRLKLEGLALCFSSSGLSEKNGLSNFAQIEPIYVFSFSISSVLENHMYCVKLCD